MCYGLRPNGVTPEGKIVVSGFDSFKLSETIGTPLELVVHTIYSNDMVIDWVEFIDTAIQTGWSLSRIDFKIYSAFIDGDVDCPETLKRIKYYLMLKGKN